MNVSRRVFLASTAGASIAKAAEKKIVFIADKASHGFAQHECNAGSLLFAKLLRENVPGIETTVHRNGWPDIPDALKDAAAVVLYTNGGPNHPALKHLDELEAAMKRGAGLAVLHYGLDIPPGPAGDQFLDWLGGHYEVNWSVNPAWTARIPSVARHPVTRGVKPFDIYDEWYFHMRFRPGMKGVTPLISAIPPDSVHDRPDGPHSNNPTVRSRKGVPEILSWAYDRPGGGRGFGFTGGHFQWVWLKDDYRKLVLNGIAWTSGVELPPDGISTSRPTYEQLLENQDKPVPEGFSAEKAMETIRPR